MRAIVIRQFGDPKQLKVEDVPTPDPGDGEALVAVRAASINPSDVKNVIGSMHATTLPRIPGRDFAGTVVRGPADLVGRDVWGTGGDIGFTRDGSHAEFLVLPVAALTPKPASLSMATAASAGLRFVTAFAALATADLSPGETALIIGAAGGVGSAAVQIAKSRGARVIAVVRSDDDIAAARASGADEAFNARSHPIPDAVRSLTHNRGADVIFDTSGMTFPDAIESAALAARVSVIAAPPDGQSTFNLRTLYRKRLRVEGIDTLQLTATASAQLLAQMLPAFESGQFKAKPAQPYPLSAAADAYAQAVQGHAVVLLPNL